VTTIVLEHRDRFARFGAEYVEATLAAQGRRLMVVDPAEVDDDLVRDVTEILTSLCARLYGRRAAANRASAPWPPPPPRTFREAIRAAGRLERAGVPVRPRPE